MLDAMKRNLEWFDRWVLGGDGVRRRQHPVTVRPAAVALAAALVVARRYRRSPRRRPSRPS